MPFQQMNITKLNTFSPFLDSTYKTQQISKRRQLSCWTGAATPEPSSAPSSKA